MAKKAKGSTTRRKSAKTKKHYPVIRKFNVGSSAGQGQTNTLLQASDLASKMNHRLYRQGMYYDLKLDLNPNATDVVHVYCLADSWMNQKAWSLAYQTYLNNSLEEEGRRSRWSDFRVKATLASSTGALPLAYNMATNTAPTQFTAGEFVNSQVRSAAGVAKEFTWDSPAASNNFGILAEYSNTFNADADPESIITDLAYVEVNGDEMDADQYEHMQDAGNEPPYNADGVSDTTPWVHVATLDASDAQKLSTGYFRALCGFVCLVGYNKSGTPSDPNDPTAPTLSIEYKAGSYKGLSAEPIGVARKTPEHKYEVK